LEAQRAGVRTRIVECTCRSSGVYLSGGVCVCVYMAPDTHQCSNWFVLFLYEVGFIRGCSTQVEYIDHVSRFH
jgi:hypothetical protein